MPTVSQLVLPRRGDEGVPGATRAAPYYRPLRFWRLSGLKLAGSSALRRGSTKAPLPRSTGLKIVSNRSIVPPLALSLPATKSKPPPKNPWPVGRLLAVLPAGLGVLTTSGLIDDRAGGV